jgi:hypothetical protein
MKMVKATAVVDEPVVAEDAVGITVDLNTLNEISPYIKAIIEYSVGSAYELDKIEGVQGLAEYGIHFVE